MSMKSILTSAAVAAVVAVPAIAETTLRIQTHYAPETVSGKLAGQFVDDVQTMSGGDLKIEMFYSSSVVATVETSSCFTHTIFKCFFYNI